MDKRVVPARVRQAVIDFKLDEAPRGAVSRFCSEHQISRSVFYKIRSRAGLVGVDAALAPASRRPKSSPNRTGLVMEQLAVQVRQDLIAQGWDGGPLSVQSRLRELGHQPPSRATLARIFSRNGVVKPQPRKRPRSSYTRFVFPKPNDCWQLDGTEFELDDQAGRRVIYQVEDDHSRMLLSWGHDVTENGRMAIYVVSQAITRYGTPKRLLTDNSVSFNSARRGIVAPLQAWVSELGIEPITGRPGRPTTQGKNERLHQTLKKYLQACRPISSYVELDQALADFADHYNQRRPHQALGGATPAQAYGATSKAEPPTRPKLPPPRHQAKRRFKGQYEVDGSIIVPRQVTSSGAIRVAGCRIYAGNHLAGQTLQIALTDTTIEVFDQHGTSLGMVHRPAPGEPTNLSIASGTRLASSGKTGETYLSTK